VSYGYDANGNMTSRGGATIGWSSYNLPTAINAPGGYSAQFAYAPDRSRWRQVSTYAGGTETTIYVGQLLEKLTTPARTHWKHRIPADSTACRAGIPRHAGPPFHGKPGRLRADRATPLP